MVQGWSQDDLQTFGELTDIRLKGSDINNDAVLDYLLFRPTPGAAQFIYVPSGVSKADVNRYSALSPQTGLPTYPWGSEYGYFGAASGNIFFQADLTAQSSKTQYLNFGLSTDVPTTRQTPSGTQVGVTRGNDFYWLDMYASFMRPPNEVGGNRTAKIAQSYVEETERQKRVNEQIEAENRQITNQYNLENRLLNTTKAAEARQVEIQKAAEARQQAFQLGDPMYQNQLRLSKAATDYSTTKQNELTLAAEARQKTFQLGTELFNFQLGLSKASTDYSTTKSTSPEVKTFQTDLANLSAKASFDLQTSDAALAFQRKLSGESATRSEEYQLAAEKRQQLFQTSEAIRKFQEDLSDYSLGKSSDVQFSEKSKAFQKDLSDYGSGLALDIQTGQWELQKAYSNEQTAQNQQFQRGLQDQSKGYGSITSGSILATNPLSRYYQGNRQGMIKGFAMGKANMGFRFNMPHRDPAKLSGKAMANKFAMKPLNMGVSKGTAMRIPNFNHTQHGKNMATAFGFTHITPVAIIHPMKQMKINPPHRPKSMAKQMRVVVGASVGRQKRKR